MMKILHKMIYKMCLPRGSMVRPYHVILLYLTCNNRVGTLVYLQTTQIPPKCHNCLLLFHTFDRYVTELVFI